MHTAQDTVSACISCSTVPKQMVRRANLTGFCKQKGQAGYSSLRTSRPFKGVRAQSSQRSSLPVVTQPWSCNDVDRDLWTVLDLASDEELEGVHDILFGNLLPVKKSDPFCHNCETSMHPLTLTAFSLPVISHADCRNQSPQPFNQINPDSKRACSPQASGQGGSNASN